MIEVLSKETFDKLISSTEVSFLGSSIYGIASEIFNNDYLLIGIKQGEQVKPILLLKEKLKKSKNYHFTIYESNTLSISKVLNEKVQKNFKKFLIKQKCLYFTLLSDGSESRNIKRIFNHLELSNNLIENFDLEVQSNINNSYKFPLNLIDVDITNIHHFCNLFSNINKEKLIKYMGEKEIYLKLVTLDIIEYIDNLTKQKNELLLKRTEEKLYEDKDDDIRIREIEHKINNIDKNIQALRQVQEINGTILYLTASIYLVYKDNLIEYKTAQNNDFNGLNARYYMSFKMLKYALNNNIKHYYDMNDDNIFKLEQITLYESKENIVKKINYKLYKKREDKKHA